MVIATGLSLVAAPVSADEICGANAYVYNIEITGEEEIVTCDCAPGYKRADGQCVEDAAVQLEALAEASLPTMSALEYDAVTGAAFNEGAELAAMVEDTDWPLKAKATFLLGVLRADRGDYEEAARFFRYSLRERPAEEWIRKALDHVLSLQAAQVVRRQAGPIAQGMIDIEMLASLPKAARDRIIIAISRVETGDYAGAADLLDEARLLAPYDPDLRDARVYVSQLVAQNRERGLALSARARAEQREEYRRIGIRDAAWRMGLFMSDIGYQKYAEDYFAEAQALVEPGSTQHRLLGELIRYADNLPPSGIKIYESRADAILDALQYGNGDWDKSILFLDIASFVAHPDDEILTEALSYVESMKRFDELTR